MSVRSVKFEEKNLLDTIIFVFTIIVMSLHILRNDLQPIICNENKKNF